jgi:hypothetical protein
MKCPSEIELNEYAEDRLATERRWEIARHLQDCPGCRTDLEGLDWATAALAGLGDLEPDEEAHVAPEDLAALREGKLPAGRRVEVLGHLSVCPECAAIYGQLPREQRALPLVRHWQPVAAAASLLLVLGLVFFVARGQLAPGTVPMEPGTRHVAERAVPPVAAAAPEAGAAGPGVAGERPIVSPPKAIARHKRAEATVIADRTAPKARDRDHAVSRTREVAPAAPAAPSPEMHIAALDGTTATGPTPAPATPSLAAAAKMTEGMADSAPPAAKGTPGRTFRPMMAPPSLGTPGAGGMRAATAPGAPAEAPSANNAMRLNAGYIALFFSNSAQIKGQCKAAGR